MARANKLNRPALLISYRKTFQGAWELSAIVNGYRIAQQYMDYTKQEATAEFLRYAKRWTAQ